MSDLATSYLEKLGVHLHSDNLAEIVASDDTMRQHLFRAWQAALSRRGPGVAILHGDSDELSQVAVTVPRWLVLGELLHKDIVARMRQVCADAATVREGPRVYTCLCATEESLPLAEYLASKTKHLARR